MEVAKAGEGDKILEELEVSRILFEVYEGGVVCLLFPFLGFPGLTFPKFIHQGMTFIVCPLTSWMIQCVIDIMA